MNQQHLRNSVGVYIANDGLEATDISKQVINIFIGNSLFECWHLTLSIFDDHPNLRWTFPVRRLVSFTIKARTKFNLAFIHGMALKASRKKNLFAGMNRLLLIGSVRLNFGFFGATK
jgi:hypothetical protein